MRFSRQIEDVIADFRGLPRSLSDAAFSEPTPLNNLLVILKERYQFEKDCPERVLVDHWAEIFGEKYAQRCSPVRIVNDDTLILAINHPVLRSNIMMDARLYLRRIQALPLCAGIKRITARAG